MPVLLLAQGDPEAKVLLRQAIEARYGLQPPVIDSLRIDFKGRVRTKVGPVMTWIPVDATAYFRLPTAMRWDFIARPLGLPVRRGIEAFDGMTLRSVRGNGKPTVINDEEQVRSARLRLWGIAAFLLTPLGEHFVRLSANGENSFEATNSKLDDTVKLYVRPDHTLDHVEVHCLNPDSEEQQRFLMYMSAEQTPVNDLMLPHKISTFWEETPFYEVEPVRVESNPTIADEVFTLEGETAS